MIRSLLLWSAILLLLLSYHVLRAQSAGDPALIIQETNVLTQERDYAGARDLLTNTIDNLLRKNDTIHPLLGELYHKLGVTQYYIGDLEAAAGATEMATRRRRQESSADRIALARTWYLQAVIRRELGDQQMARQGLRQAIYLMEENISVGIDEGNTARLMNMYAEYCRINLLAGDYVTAYRYWDKANRFFLEKPDLYSTNLAGLQSLKGQILKRQGKYPEAISAFEYGRDLWIGSGVDARSDIAGIDNDLGLVYLEMGASEIARVHFTQALEEYGSLLAEQPVKYYQQESANVISNLILVSQADDSAQTIREYYRLGLHYARLAWPGKVNPLIADLQMNMGLFFSSRLELDSALRYHQQSLQTLLPNWPQQSLTQHPLLHKPKLLSAFQLQLEALLQSYQERSALRDLEAAYRLSLTTDTLIYLIRQSYESAQSKYQLIDREWDFYEKALVTALNLHETTGKREYLEGAYRFCANNKAGVLLEGLQDQEAKQFAGIPQALLEKEWSLKRKYYQLEHAIRSAYEEGQYEKEQILKDSLFGVRQSYQQLIGFFENSYPTYFQLKYVQNRSFLLNDLQRSVPKNVLLLEYFVGKSELIVFAVSREQVRYYRSDLPPDFAEQCSRFRRLNSERTPNIDTFRLLGHQFFEQLLAAPLSDAGISNKRRLLIIPDHVLLQFPFESLLVQSSQPGASFKTLPFLLQSFAVSYAYSSRLLIHRKSEKKLKRRNRFAGFGLEYDDYTLKGMEALDLKIQDSSGDGRSVGPLIYADDEVREIASLMTGDTWINAEATKSAFMEHAPNYRILHLSMHGLLDEQDPMSSALVFSRTPDSTDFLLRTSELFGLELPADLAVLSACHTGYGPLVRGEGIRSISRAFTYAGCSSLVASLWSASDKSSMDILTVFYENLQNGLSKDVALQLAKLSYIDSAPPTLSVPSHWAHLIHIGESAPLGDYQNNRYRLGIFLVAAILVGGFFYRRWSSKAKNQTA